MKFLSPFSPVNRRSAAVVAAGLSLFLSSCGEKEASEAVVAPAPAEAAAPEVKAEPAPVVDQLAETRKALFESAVYKLAARTSNPEMFPELNSLMKDMLELMRAYYAELQKGEPSEERVRLAVQIAATTRDLGAYTKARAEYDNALQELQKLPEEVQKSATCQRLLSSCKNGIGHCLLVQNKASEALPYYEEALALDSAQFMAVGPKEGEGLPEGEVDPVVSRAAADLLDAYRCLGDCQRAMEDPEEARTTYKHGHDLAQRLRRLSAEMSISYVKLLTSLGNLDNALGKPSDALGSWVMAAKICQGLNGSSPKLDVKAETKRCFDALLPAIQSVSQQLQAAHEEAETKAAEEKAAMEKAAAEQAAAEKEAAERLAAEEAAAKEAEAAAAKAAEEKKATSSQEETNKRVRRSRRRR